MDCLVKVTDGASLSLSLSLFSALISLPGWHCLTLLSHYMCKIVRSLENVFSKMKSLTCSAYKPARCSNLNSEILYRPARKKIHYFDVDGKLHINLVWKFCEISGMFIIYGWVYKYIYIHEGMNYKSSSPGIYSYLILLLLIQTIISYHWYLPAALIWSSSSSERFFVSITAQYKHTLLSSSTQPRHWDRVSQDTHG